MFALWLVLAVVVSFLAGAVASLFHLPRSLVFRWLKANGLATVRADAWDRLCQEQGRLVRSTIGSAFLCNLRTRTGAVPHIVRRVDLDPGGA